MKSILKKILTKISYKKYHKEVKNYIIGSYALVLPCDHKLPEYQRHFKNYDKKIKNIIQSIEQYQSKGVIVDIGANVGDTAAYIRTFTDARIVCVEGDRYYLNYLEKNITQLPDVKIVPVFVQGRNSSINYQSIRKNGTAKLEKNTESSASFLSLSSIFKENNISVVETSLIKIDTDGFDFDILLANKDLIRKTKPTLYFEYDISYNPTDKQDSIELINMLETLDYGFVVYDNFGNLLNVIEKECVKEFIKLNHYLDSCRQNNGGIYYYDVFAATNKNVIRNIWEKDFSE